MNCSGVTTLNGMLPTARRSMDDMSGMNARSTLSRLPALGSAANACSTVRAFWRRALIRSMLAAAASFSGVLVSATSHPDWNGTSSCVAGLVVSPWSHALNSAMVMGVTPPTRSLARPSENPAW